MIVPDRAKAVHFRNFIMGTSSRSFAVGYPGGTNLVFDQELCTLAMLWEGDFINAAPRWHAKYGNGTSDRSPAVHFAKWALLSRPDHGIQTDGDGSNLYPTFRYHNQQFVINDRPEPSEEGLKRILQIKAKQDGSLKFSPLGQPVEGLQVISVEGIAPQGLVYELPLKKGANKFIFEYRTL